MSSCEGYYFGHVSIFMGGFQVGDVADKQRVRTCHWHEIVGRAGGFVVGEDGCSCENIQLALPASMCPETRDKELTIAVKHPQPRDAITPGIKVERRPERTFCCYCCCFTRQWRWCRCCRGYMHQNGKEEELAPLNSHVALPLVSHLLATKVGFEPVATKSFVGCERETPSGLDTQGARG